MLSQIQTETKYISLILERTLECNSHLLKLWKKQGMRTYVCSRHPVQQQGRSPFGSEHSLQKVCFGEGFIKAKRNQNAVSKTIPSFPHEHVLHMYLLSIPTRPLALTYFIQFTPQTPC